MKGLIKMQEKTHSNLVDFFRQISEKLNNLSLWSKGHYVMISEEDILSIGKIEKDMREKIVLLTNDMDALDLLLSLKVRNCTFYGYFGQKWDVVVPSQLADLDKLSLTKEECFFICEVNERYEDALKIVKDHILTLAKSYASYLKRSWDVVKTLGGNRRLEDCLKRLLKKSDFFELTSDDLDYIWQILLVNDDVFGKRDKQSSDTDLRRRKT